MKIGIITDIHSNIHALNSVINEFNKIKVDKIICCGDIIGIGANPEEVVQRLIQIKDKLIIVKGNHEQYLLNGLPKEVHDNKRKMNADEIKNHEWNQSKLSEVSKKFIKTFKITETIQIENKKIYIVHYPLDESGKYKRHIKKPTTEENEKMFQEIEADIFVYGHTHTISVNNKNEKWYINCGTLGCPMKTNIANAGILEISGDKVEYEQLSIEYDVSVAISEIEKLKFPFYKEILRIFY